VGPALRGCRYERCRGRSPLTPARSGRGVVRFGRQALGSIGNKVRDHAVERLESMAKPLAAVVGQMNGLAPRFHRTAVLTELKGVGLFSAMVVVAELVDVTRFRCAKQAAAYPGPTARVF
jgi:transposase